MTGNYTSQLIVSLIFTINWLVWATSSLNNLTSSFLDNKKTTVHKQILLVHFQILESMSDVRMELFIYKFVIFVSELIFYIGCSDTAVIFYMALDLGESSAIQQSATYLHD